VTVGEFHGTKLSHLRRYLPPMVHVREAVSAEDFQEAARLLRDFPAHQREHYKDHLAVVERYFDPVAYEKELGDLPAKYGAPDGCVLLGFDNEELVGAVCLHRLDSEACEMKRLFVPIAHRRKGVAEALSLALLDAARNKGYGIMRLDTGAFLVESQALYRKLGFTYTEPYYAAPEVLRDGLVFMQIRL